MSGLTIKRSDEREFALQMLYAGEFNRDPWPQQIGRLEVERRQNVTAYVEKLVEIYHDHKSEFDKKITARLENWELKRVAVIDKVILRLALSEIFYFDDIPPEVSINEAIELAKKYSTSRSSKFINGVLDAIYRTYKEEQTKKNRE
jgi:transcription antitermination factor NusB